MAFDVFDTDPYPTVGLTLSGGNLTGTRTAATVNIFLSCITQAREGKFAGKWYVEWTYNAIGTGGNPDGVGTVQATGVGQDGFIGDAAGWGYYSNGNVVNGGSAITAVNNTTFGAGAVIGGAIDLDNKRIWFRLNGGGWIGTSGTPNPTTNTGGFDMTADMSFGRTYPAANYSGQSASWTANFGASGFSAGVPGGFTAGWTNTGGDYFGTFASTGYGGSLRAMPTAGEKIVTPYTANLSRNVASFIVPYENTMDSSVGLIYADASGVPGALLGVSSNTINLVLGEQTFNFSAVAVVAGTQYWFGVAMDASARIPAVQGYAYPNGTAHNSAPSVAAPSNPFGTPNFVNFRLPIIVNLGASQAVRPVLFCIT